MTIYLLKAAQEGIYWRSSSPDGEELLRGSALLPGERLAPCPPPDDNTAITAVHPGPNGRYLVVLGRPGGDYGHLWDCANRTHGPLVRTPSIVWSLDGRSLVYLAYRGRADLTDVPTSGLAVFRHRLGTDFTGDECLHEFAEGSLATLRETTDDTVVVRTSDRHGLTDHLKVSGLGGAGTTAAVGPLWPGTAASGAAGDVLPSGTVWWTTQRLGRADYRVRAVDPDTGRFVDQIRLPPDWTVRQAVATGDHLLMRATRSAEEAMFLASSADRSLTRIDLLERKSTVIDVAGSARASLAAWVETTPRYGETLRAVAGHPPATVALGHCAVPAPLPASRAAAVAPDGARLSVYLSRLGDGDVRRESVLIEHTGPRGYDRLPLEQSLEALARRRGAQIARVRTRPLGRAKHSQAGRVAYDDCLSGLKGLEDSCLGKPVLYGYSLGAVSAARALLRSPGSFCAAVMRFPISDLTNFHRWGVGALWASQLGFPDDPDDAAALRQLSPCHMRAESVAGVPVLVQVGSYDTRADRRHGLALARRLERLGYDVDLREYRTGHDESRPTQTVLDAVREAISFTEAVLDQSIQGGTR